MADWQIGFAETDMTPEPGRTNGMAGFGRNRYANGAVAPLRAQALYLCDAGGRQSVLLTADILHFDRIFVDNLRLAVQRATGLAAESVMLAPSHTHWGPAAGYRVLFCIGSPDPWYREWLHNRLVALAVEAQTGATTGQIAYTATTTQIGHNRRKPDGQGGVTWGPAPEKHYDRHTPVLELRRAGDVGRIIVVGHACHPTSSGTVDKWSPDYPGAMRTRIEEKLGPDTRAMFVMGCGADAKVTHVDPKSKDIVFSASPAKAKAAGNRLGDSVLRALKTATATPLPATLRCSLVRGHLTLAPAATPEELAQIAYGGEVYFNHASWAQQALAFPDTRRKLEYEVQAWQFGDVLTVIGLEGEVCSELGPIARGLATTPQAMAVGYTNATQGYIPTAEIVREGGYEGDTSHRAYALPSPFTEAVETEFGRIVKRAIRAAAKAEAADAT